MIKVNQEIYAMIVKGLMTKPMSIDEMQDLTGMHRKTLYRLMRTFRGKKIVYISDWEQDRFGRDCKAIYTMGIGKDKPRYKTSSAERTRRYRERMKMAKIPTSIAEINNQFISIN